MSGADLDGDEFWIITQKDLLPRPQAEINALVPKQDFDDQGVRRLSEYIDNTLLVDYCLEYQLLENTAELASIHEAFTDHFEEGMGHKDCLLIAKYHSYALDFAKTGVIVPIPKEAGIPNNDEIRNHNLRIWPHYLLKNPAQTFKSNRIKGRLFDFIYSKLPNKFKNDRKFQKDVGLDKLRMNAPLRPFKRASLQSMDEQKYDNDAYDEQQQSQSQSQRYENLDDYSSYNINWHDDRMQNETNSDSDRSGSGDPALMEWFENVDYLSLIDMIPSKRVRLLLYDGERHTVKEIDEFKVRLERLQREISNEIDSIQFIMKTEVDSAAIKDLESRVDDLKNEQYQAFHVDYYYECILQKNKVLSQQQQPMRYEYSDSDDVNENEEEKRADL